MTSAMKIKLQKYKAYFETVMTDYNKPEKKEREYWIDAVRSFACICVITTHAPIPNGSDGSNFIAFFNYYAAGGASILFFMISGALVLYKPKDLFPFIKKRVSRIALPMIIWSIICLVIGYYLGDISSSKALFQKILLIPFFPQVGSYWFIYVIFGIYLITPILAQWLDKHNKKEVSFYILLWGITLFLPYLDYFNKNLESIISVSGGILYYFYGYLGFALLGYYLRKYELYFSKRIFATISILIVFFPWALYLTTTIPHDIIQNRMSINLALIAALYFILIKHLHLSEKMKSFFYDFAQHSFGIYLVHLLIMRKIIWAVLSPYNIHYLIQIPLIVFLTTLLSYLLVHLFAKLPFSKYIVGL